MGTTISVIDVGGKLKAIRRDLQIDAKTFKRGMLRGLQKAALHIIRTTKRDYLRRPDTSFSRAHPGIGRKHGHRLSRITGNLASTMTHKIDPVRMMAKIGWFRHEYAHVVAEPPEGREKTVIKPKTKRILFFPLSRMARNVWEQRGKPYEYIPMKAGKKGLIIGGKSLYEDKDYAFARQTTVRARRPASKALHKESMQVARIVLQSVRVLGRTGK